MRRPRFLISDLFQSNSPELTGEERHHAVDVLRMSVGASLVVFDEQGRTADAEVIAITQDAVKLHLVTSPQAPLAARIPLTLAVAAPKQKRADWLVEKCAELGVAKLQFIESVRGEVTPSPNRIDRWQRKATEAAKQSGSLPVMRISPTASIDAVISELAEGHLAVFGATEVAADSIHAWFDRHSTKAQQPTTCFIGPEGGWDSVEIELLLSHATAVRFHPHTLRIETAAVAFAAIWQARMYGES